VKVKVDIYNGEYVGTAEWHGPGEVALHMDSPTERSWFEYYFSAEDSYMGGPVDVGEMSCERRDSSERAFFHAAFRLAAYDYTVRFQSSGMS
jgi:hypothetical protein